MDGRTIDPMTVFQRGHKNAHALSEEELMVFLLMEFETIMDMEGWNHFYCTKYMEFYPELKSALKLIGDHESLAVVMDYEAFLEARGVPMEPGAINSFWTVFRDYENLPDWRADFSDHVERRWRQVELYLAERGIQLLV